MDISQESRALICTLLKESSEKDRELHLSMYGKAAQLQKQMDAKSAWFQEKYSGLIHGGYNVPKKAILAILLISCEGILQPRSGFFSSVPHEEVSKLSTPVMASGKNGDDGDLLLFRDGPGTCDMSAGALRELSGTLLESD
ncbi:hypothetical protein Tco_0503639 [Tanacetum coccineum]